MVSDSRPQILTGTNPFSDASDEDIVTGVKMGYRPDCPYHSPSQELLIALWDQIEACWHDDPEQRPAALTVLQFLQCLDQERTKKEPQEPQILEESREPQEQFEFADDNEWDYIKDSPEIPSAFFFYGSGPLAGLTLQRFSGHKEHFSLSGSTLVNSSFGRFFALPHHSESDTKRDPSKGRRARAKKHVRHLFHLPEHGSAVAEAIGKHGPKTEIIDQREENVQISDGSVSYLTSKPIPSGKRLKKVVITVDSKDQGWSSYQDDHGTYNNSWTWFELSVGQPSDKGAVEKWRGEVVRNLHAHGEFKEHTIKITDKKLYERARSGDVLTVWAHARYSGWRNTVKKAKIRCVVE